MNDVTKDLLDALREIVAEAQDFERRTGQRVQGWPDKARAAISRAEAALSADELADMMKRARPCSAPVLAPSPPTRRHHIDALVGDALTGRKASEICERYGYTVTGVVLGLPDGRACIVNRSTVRWLDKDRDLWNLMFQEVVSDVSIYQQAVAEFLQRSGQYVTNAASREAALDQARAEEREACVWKVDKLWAQGPMVVIAAIRARGQK